MFPSDMAIEGHNKAPKKFAFEFIRWLGCLKAEVTSLWCKISFNFWYHSQPFLKHIEDTFLLFIGVNASATTRVISRRWNDDDEISILVEEPGVPGGNHRPTASNQRNFSHMPLPSPGIELEPQRCEAKWAKAWWERRLSSLSYTAPLRSFTMWIRTVLTY